ncbi:MAG: ABC transporter permease [Promethearchaeota archaeon]
MDKESFIRDLKFFIIPFWRDPQFSEREYEIGKIKSKRKFFTLFLTPLTITGVLLVLFIGIIAVFPQWLINLTLNEATSSTGWFVPFDDPNSVNLLGTTKFGYDIVARLVWGARTALTMGLQSNIISITGGVTVGLISAYFGGLTDSLIMRGLDVIRAFPNFILALLFISLMGQKMEYILMAYGIIGIPGYARFIRALVFQVKTNVYVEAAKTSGASNFKIMFKHILPNAMSPLIVVFFGAIGGSILGMASLAYIGLGDAKISDWGTDINWGRSRLYTKPWISLWPGFFIAITVLGFMLIGDGLRDALDPRLRK